MLCGYLFRRKNGRHQPGKSLVQLSGGEPTVRDDLPEIIAFAKACGAKYVQLNSNGIRLAEDEDFVKSLAEAGLSFVFMQFDGTNNFIQKKLRNKALLETKLKAIAHCDKYHLGVTLVPTLVQGVNTGNIGEIIKLALTLSPAVRGVHFQPASYFGRIPNIPNNDERFTLGELLDAIPKQTAGLVKPENLIPSCCDHPLCGFHGSFVVLPEGALMPLTLRENKNAMCSCNQNPAEQNREYVGSRWQRGECCSSEDEVDLNTLEGFAKRGKAYGFTITAMVFQDAWNLDLNRLRYCSLHVYREGRHVPLCANYLTSVHGEKLNRK